jgi:hypothetical protein
VVVLRRKTRLHSAEALAARKVVRRVERCIVEEV